MNKKALIAMSGGVDSSVSAYLMKKAGYDCTGVMMKLFENSDPSKVGDRTCCSLDDAEDARSVAFRLGIPFYVFNFTGRFEDCVIKRFVNAYETGATPNPCIDCNRYLKFDQLFLKAKEMSFDRLVTGHYARIEKNPDTGRYELKKAVDETKDQSYVLYSLTQEQLSHTCFPLGTYSKSEVRKIAESQGFLNADKRDSQDICFVPDGDYASFIEQYSGRTFPEGDFVDQSGNIMGRHKGIIHYTIGQRKGLGLAVPEPVYVCRLDLEGNRVILGKNEDLFSNSLTASDINLISVPEIKEPMRLKAKVRYRQKEQWATVVQTGEDTIRVDFEEPQRAITKGQAVVLYDGETVVGGGTIQTVL